MTLPPQVERARELALAYGWNATSYQIVNPGMDLWFSRRGDAVVGYVRRHRVRVVGGAPICPKGRLRDVLAEWERVCERGGDMVCYFGAAGRVMDLYRDNPRYSTVVLGAQPVWTPDRWPAVIESLSSLRYQLHRARNKGVAVSLWEPERAEGNPELQRCLDEWLQTRGLPPLHFLVEPETLGFLQDRLTFVAEKEGRVVGFLNACPAPVRRGWLTEQFVRGWEAPNGTVELMMDFAVRAMARRGADYVTMGLVPLSSHGESPRYANPPWLKLLLAWVRAHGCRFYNFEGLDFFKSKFCPQYWEPIYAISNEAPFSLHALYAIAAAFTRTSPVVAVAKGIGRAVRQEYLWLQERAAKTPRR